MFFMNLVSLASFQNQSNSLGAETQYLYHHRQAILTLSVNNGRFG